MKEGFLKANWLGVLMVIVFTIVSIITQQLVIIIIALLYVIVMVHTYITYDIDEQQHNEWWSKLSKKEKGEIYSKSLLKDGEAK